MPEKNSKLVICVCVCETVSVIVYIDERVSKFHYDYSVLIESQIMSPIDSTCLTVHESCRLFKIPYLSILLLFIFLFFVHSRWLSFTCAAG